MRMPGRATLSSVLAVLIAVGVMVWMNRAPAYGPKNMGFEDGVVGGVPKGWRVERGPSPSDYAIHRTERNPRSGDACAVIELRGPRPAGGFGSLSQFVDATAYRGKQVRLKAAVRTEGVRTRARLWMRVDRRSGELDDFETTYDRPIVSATWSDHDIIGDVEEDAVLVTFGVKSSHGTGSVWIDDVSLEILGAAQFAPPEAARPLAGRALDNLVAFAKLYGYVRFFHPSDQAAALSPRAWSLFAIPAVADVEGAASPEALATSLAGVFRSVAPTLEVWVGGPDDASPSPPRSDEAKGATCWLHHGCGILGRVKPGSPYSSVRVPVPLSSSDAKLPAPGTCIVRDLGSGVSCRLCVALDVDAEGDTLPRPAVAPPPTVSRHTPRRRSSGHDRTTRLADVVVAWNVFQHFYPYFDVSKPDWPAVLTRSLAAAATDVDETAFLLTLRRLVAELGDGHGRVYGSRSSFRLAPAMGVDWADDGRGGTALVVVAVGAGADVVRVGDEIVAVAGTPTATWYTAALPLVSAATEAWARHRIATDADFLAPGTRPECEFTIRRDGKESVVRVPRFMPSMHTPRIREKFPVNGAEVGPKGSGIVYFDLSWAKDDALAAAMPKLQAAKGIIFDARGYPNSAGRTLLRHLSDQSFESARWNVPVVTLPDQDPAGLTWDEGGRWNDPPALPRLGGGGQKIAFLTGGGAISYAESCLGVVEAYQLGEIVGGPTAGTNGNVNRFTLPGGFHVDWTGMKVLKHDGSRHHGVGIAPTVPVRRTLAGIAAGRDEILDAAVKKLSE